MLFLKGVGPAMIVPVEMSNLFGSLGFIKKSASGGSVFWLPCMVVGPCDKKLQMARDRRATCSEF